MMSNMHIPNELYEKEYQGKGSDEMTLINDDDENDNVCVASILYLDLRIEPNMGQNRKRFFNINLVLNTQMLLHTQHVESKSTERTEWANIFSKYNVSIRFSDYDPMCSFVSHILFSLELSTRLLS